MHWNSEVCTYVFGSLRMEQQIEKAHPALRHARDNPLNVLVFPRNALQVDGVKRQYCGATASTRVTELCIAKHHRCLICHKLLTSTALRLACRTE